MFGGVYNQLTEHPRVAFPSQPFCVSSIGIPSIGDNPPLFSFVLAGTGQGDLLKLTFTYEEIRLLIDILTNATLNYGLVQRDG